MNAKQRRARARAPYRRAWLHMRAQWTAMPPALKRETIATLANIRSAIEREVLALFAQHGGKVPATSDNVAEIQRTVAGVLHRSVDAYERELRGVELSLPHRISISGAVIV